MKLVIYPPVDDARLGRIDEAAGPMDVVNAVDEESARQAIVDADAFFGKLTPSLLAASTRLKWVQSPTASLEHYIFPELVDHPCTLTNMRGLFSDVIADHVFGYILCFARNLHVYLRQQRRCEYAPVGGEEVRAGFAGGQSEVNAIDRSHMHMADCTLGIVGLGSIGKEIARRGLAFGMRVLAVDPVATQAPAGVEALWLVNRLDHLLAQSDFVVIAAPHTPETVKMFRLAQFEQMKSTGYLINIGRGAIVDLSALVEALNRHEIAGAALDVFEVEPLPAEHPLWAMENVLITPHVASASVRIAERHLAVLLENVRRFVEGKRLHNIANKQTWF